MPKECALLVNFSIFIIYVYILDSLERMFAVLHHQNTIFASFPRSVCVIHTVGYLHHFLMEME